MTTTDLSTRSLLEPRPLDELSRTELRLEVKRARIELASTLNAIEDRLNVPRKMRERTERWGRELDRLRTENPVALAGVAVGVAVVIGGAVWGIVTLVTRD
ncbi:DUF3618 domain-containing protein [Leifsonia sp. YIM 134122]|uniref:DUF3618 domain-containing protein n=1 Tax=Leifsonia stereocauli TaxID=3134136 RepID=A0ABU9W567_9MICO